jgi:hypothetical protein
MPTSFTRLLEALFRQPLVQEIRAQHLVRLERELLEVQLQKEYFTAMEVALATGIDRLKGTP